MSGYKSFAIIGYGIVGSHLIDALAEAKSKGAVSSVILLTRSAEGKEDLKSKGVEIRTVNNYDDVSSLESAFTGVDVVLSAVAAAALAAQCTIAKAAKAAGVKLFSPSDYGSSTEGYTEGPFAVKEAIKEYLKSIDLPFASFHVGGFPDLVFKPGFVSKAVGFDFADGKFTVAGEGNAEISFTHTRDVANFVAHVLTTLPRDKIEGRTFGIEGDRTTFNKAIAIWEAATGKTADVTHRPISEYKEKLSKNPEDFVSFLLIVFDSGRCVSGKPDELANSEWPEWKPQSVKDVITDIFKA